MNEVTYQPVTYGKALHLSVRRMRQRLGYLGAGNPFVGGDNVRLWAFKREVERVSTWLNERVQRQHPDDVLPRQMMRAMLRDDWYVEEGFYTLALRQDGYRDVAPEHHEAVFWLATGPTQWPKPIFMPVDRASAV